MSSADQRVMPVSEGAAARAGGAEATSATTARTVTPASRTELIQRMLREALEEPSPVAANLQMNGGDLLEMSLILKDSIVEAAHASSEPADLRELQSFIDTYVKVCRQADRVLRLKHEITQTLRSGVPRKTIA